MYFRTKDDEQKTIGSWYYAFQYRVAQKQDGGSNKCTCMSIYTIAGEQMLASKDDTVFNTKTNIWSPFWPSVYIQTMKMHTQNRDF